MLDPHAIEKRADLDEVGAVMVVSPFGAPVNTRSWDEFTERTGIPVVIDGAAAFDTISSVETARPAKTPVMISLHATKVFGIGEGGFVVSTDADVMRRFRQICNFGFWGEPCGQILGYNGKLSEYHAAVGLAAFEVWPQQRTRMVRLTHEYLERLARVSAVSTLPGYGSGWVSCYCNVRVRGDAAPVIEHLEREGIQTRRWWKSGVHEQTAYEVFDRDELPVTQMLAREVFGLPFLRDMTNEQFDRVVSALECSLAQSSRRATAAARPGP